MINIFIDLLLLLLLLLFSKMVSQSSKLIIFLENFTTIIPFDEILSLTFDVGPFKMNIYDIRQKSIL